jgi:hypothetical protein
VEEATGLPEDRLCDDDDDDDDDAINLQIT